MNQILISILNSLQVEVRQRTTSESKVIIRLIGKTNLNLRLRREMWKCGAVNFVARHSIGTCILKITWEFTLEKDLILVNFVRGISPKRVLWLCIWKERIITILLHSPKKKVGIVLYITQKSSLTLHMKRTHHNYPAS